MNIPRELLPQIETNQLEEFKTFLEGHGVWAEFKQLPARSLKPIQEHVNKEKVAALMKDPVKRAGPLIVSETGYILDGHHRWLAELAAAKDESPDSDPSMKCLWCHCSIKTLFELAHQFDGSFTKTVHEIRLVNFIPNRLF
jgi:hypothetical protein